MSQSYSGTAKALHWTIVALLIGQFIFAWTMPHIGRDTPVTTIISLHFTFGIIILALAIVRLAWRLTHAEPPPEDGLPPWQAKSAHVVQWALYLLLFAAPVLGWINASWRNMPIVMFGLELPKLVATRAPGLSWSGDVHGILGNYVMLPLIALHVLAGLYHYFFRRDGVLQRIFPRGWL